MNDRHSDSPFFKPAEVDEQIDSLSQLDASTHNDAEFIHALRNLYIPVPQQEQQMLDTIWHRIEQEVPRAQQKQQKNRMPVTMLEEDSTIITPPFHQQRRKRSFFFRLDTLVASLLLVSIVGTLIFFFAQTHHQSMSTPRGDVTPTPTMFPSKQIGNIVYTSTTSVGLPAWSPDSQRLATGEVQVQSWDATTGQNVVTYDTENANVAGGVGGVAWSPDGKHIAVTHIRQIPVKIYNAATGQLEGEYDPGPLALSNISPFAPLSFASSHVPTSSGGPGAFATAWSPDGKRMATAFGYAAAGAYSIQIWDTSTKQLLLSYTDQTDFVQTLAWSYDGKYILSATYDGQSTQVWDSQTGKHILDLESHQQWSNVAWVAWSPNKDIIAYGIGDTNADNTLVGYTIKLIDVVTGKVLLTRSFPISNDDQFLGHLSEFPLNIIWSPDGRSIASGIGSMQLWDTTTGKTYYTFTDQGYFVYALAWSPNGEYIASTDAGINTPGKLRVWIAR